MTSAKSESNDSTFAFLRLARLSGVGPVLVKRLLAKLGTAEAILEGHPSTLAGVEGIGMVKANQIVASAKGTEGPAREELSQAREMGLTLLTFGGPGYPPGLLGMDDPPLVLYVRGKILPQDAVAVGIVGARECTLYGREQAGRFGAGAQAGLCVVSGGARGIDTCAHLGAMRAGGRTIVVQGCGLLHTYPPENVDLYKRIAAEGVGAVISELPLDAPPMAGNFPPRNRIIVGMSLGILVVEANLKSGSLITARLAAADYGREVFALPGRVDSAASAGTHHLIKTATAHLVESAQDILDHLGDVGAALVKAQIADVREEAEQESLFSPVETKREKPKMVLTSVQEKIVAAIGKGAGVDEIVDATGLAAQVIMVELTSLQIAGVIGRVGANRFVQK